MKLLKKFPLHLQIIAALILGAAFGAVFSVDPYLLLLEIKEDKDISNIEITQWEKIDFAIEKDGESQILARFSSDDQIQIVKYYKNLSKADKQNTLLKVISESDTVQYSNIQSLRQPQTIATEIKPIGTLFIRLLSFLAIPLVLASLIVGASSLDDIKKIGRIGGKTFVIYIFTTAIAITIGISIANIMEPGNQIDKDSTNRLLGTYQSETSEKIVEELEVDIPDFIVSIVPKNPINAMAEGNMLQIVFFALLFGITLTFIEKKKSEAVVNVVSGISDAMIKMVDFIMRIAPYGVFALIAATISQFGLNIISTLLWYIVAVILGLLIQTVIVYGSIVKFLGKIKPSEFFKAMRNAQAIGFSTSSSAATLPVTFDCTENKLGLPKHITGFVLPLGATINMDGTALYQGVAAVFIAQVYGFDLNILQQLTIVFTAVLASIGTAPVPGVGIIMLVMILQAIHVPAEGIALILGVDRILDMCRTITNVTGDAAVAAAIAGSEEKYSPK